MPSDDIEDSASDSDTDTDEEYDTQIRAIQGNRKITNVDELYRVQRGVCRITSIPFGEGIYAPAVVPRRTRKPLANDNAMLVLSIVQEMHSARPDLSWRLFASLLHTLGERAEI